MNTKDADKIKNVMAFIVARYKDDEDAALAVIGVKTDPTYEPTEEEMKAVYDNVLDLILGVTDFAISQIEMLALLMRVDTDTLIQRLALGMAVML